MINRAVYRGAIPPAPGPVLLSVQADWNRPVCACSACEQRVFSNMACWALDIPMMESDFPVCAGTSARVVQHVQRARELVRACLCSVAREEHLPLDGAPAPILPAVLTQIVLEYVSFYPFRWMVPATSQHVGKAAPKHRYRCIMNSDRTALANQSHSVWHYVLGETVWRNDSNSFQVSFPANSHLEVGLMSEHDAAFVVQQQYGSSNSALLLCASKVALSVDTLKMNVPTDAVVKAARFAPNIVTRVRVAYDIKDGVTFFVGAEKLHAHVQYVFNSGVVPFVRVVMKCFVVLSPDLSFS